MKNSFSLRTNNSNAEVKLLRSKDDLIHELVTSEIKYISYLRKVLKVTSYCLSNLLVLCKALNWPQILARRYTLWNFWTSRAHLKCQWNSSWVCLNCWSRESISENFSMFEIICRLCQPLPNKRCVYGGELFSLRGFIFIMFLSVLLLLMTRSDNPNWNTNSSKLQTG